MKQLSPEPDLKNPLLGQLGGELTIRVTARNLAGFGDCSELTVSAVGEFMNFISGKSINCLTLRKSGVFPKRRECHRREPFQEEFYDILGGMHIPVRPS